MTTTSSKISPVGTNNYKTDVTTNTDGSLKATTFRVDKTGANPVAVSTVNTTKDGKSTRTMESGATAAEKTAFNNPNSPERQVYAQQVQSQSPYGANPSAEQTQQLNNAAGKPNQATTGPDNASGQQGGTPETAAEAAKEANSYKENTRAGDNAYENLKYPENLAETLQDTVRFSILEYSPSLAKQNQSQGGTGQFGSTKERIVTLESSGIPIVKGSKRIGVITLPIPAGINDGNTVGWQNDELSMVGQELGNAAKAFFEGGVAGAGGQLDSVGNRTEGAIQSGDLQTTVKKFFLDKIAGSQNFGGRAYGVASNNNLELLFSNPNLRSFAFQFSFYPRSEPESVMVRRIIRAFKQSMSVKRSKTSLLLKAPHTFAISYFTSVNGQLIQHPYLNSFKECALTSCSVDYTPDGTYMTYGGKEKSMTAYRLSLQFQELEPIFDDEYYDIDKNKDTYIGF